MDEVKFRKKNALELTQLSTFSMDSYEYEYLLLYNILIVYDHVTAWEIKVVRFLGLLLTRHSGPNRNDCSLAVSIPRS